MTKISFVVRVKNQAPWIKSTINSLKKIQGNFRSEFIFIDYNSSDNSLDLIKEYSKELPRTTIVTSNKKEVYCPLKGLMLSGGEYISFLDGDNIVNPEAHNYLLDLLKLHKKAIAIGSAANIANLTKDINSLYSLSSKKEEVNMLDYLINTQKIINVSSPCALIKKSLLLDAVNYNNSFLY
ncbi:MAG: glycosyltransferase family A protein [Rickettsiaceae bacterium]|nr:glycosyltransferase family A protein [Rickettsiaceae bacterium]